MKIGVLFLIFTVINSAKLYASTRDELHRYTLIRDRIIIDRELKKEVYHQFLDLEVSFSSGIKKLIGDIKAANSDEKNSIEKQVAIIEVLNKNLNSEKYIDADLGLAAPLPSFKFWGYGILPAAFYQMNISASLSINNQESALDPVAQVFLKREEKLGLSSVWYKKKFKKIKFNLYRMTRYDLKSSETASSISEDGEILNTDELELGHSSISFDLSWAQELFYFDYLLEVKEFKIKSLTVDKESVYGHNFLFNSRVFRKFNWNYGELIPFIGFHYRARYALANGIYIGARATLKKVLPLAVNLKVSNEFLTINPQIISKYVQFNYSFKTPFRNPQDGVWVPAIHSFNLSFPFP